MEWVEKNETLFFTWCNVRGCCVAKITTDYWTRKRVPNGHERCFVVVVLLGVVVIRFSMY